jgi:asparagine synthetase B (glutamine-hydrolysing)
MSDFIYSKKQIKKGKLTKAIQSIYGQDGTDICEYHGAWGSLAVSKNLYNGFESYETENHITVVIGGPLLKFSDNHFIGKPNASNEGTKAVYERWLNKSIKWDEDLDGPYAVLIIDKKEGKSLAVTDLLSFIPLFTCENDENIFLSTHVDALAIASNQTEVDKVSIVDFILHGTITYPYTMYKKIHQIQPASVHWVKNDTNKVLSETYWLPKEEIKYKSIDKAAKDLQKAITTYTNTILANTTNIAQFISGGEDSRTLSALLSSVPNHDAYIFLDQMNREGTVAQKTAKIYGINFKLFTRDKLHYLTVLPACTNLVGSGSEYIHAHTYGFHEKCNLHQYDAVFGGLFADALLKGARIRKIRGSKRFPFIPQIKDKFYAPSNMIKNSAFKSDILKQLNQRRNDHYQFIKTLRNESAVEWFEMWPSTMNLNVPNIHANRRLFRSYEPFMANDIIKISAAVPQKWKMNRRLFNKFAKPYLKPSKWLMHSEGRLPYFPWYINCFIQFGFWAHQEIKKKLGLIKGNQGPWAEWSSLMNTNEWQNAIENYSTGIKFFSDAVTNDDIKAFYNNKDFNYLQRINILQILYKTSSLGNSKNKG